MRADAHLRFLCVKCTGTNDKAAKAFFFGYPERTLDAPVFPVPRVPKQGLLGRSPGLFFPLEN